MRGSERWPEYAREDDWRGKGLTGVSLHLIPRARWHNVMKAPPCMRWRGLHPAFVARAARFLRPVSHLSAFTEPLTFEAPVAQRFSRGITSPRGFPRSSDPSSAAFRLGDKRFSTPAARAPQGVRPTFSRLPMPPQLHPQNPTGYPPSSQFSSQVVHIQGRGQTHRWLTLPLNSA